MAWCSSRIEKSAIDILGDCTSKTKKNQRYIFLIKIALFGKFFYFTKLHFFREFKEHKSHYVHIAFTLSLRSVCTPYFPPNPLE